ncbi:MAG: polysaccharide deacetylase family protein [Methanoregulaceae archaeon]|jgi:peptidoglycan/xylan/chitin deacetylase (PgdA/CDA1 family)
MIRTQQEVLIVMYHFIRPKTELPYTTLPVENFRRQLKYLKMKYPIITLGDVIDGKHGCVLTFDDGIKDHYTNVFPILKKEEIPGVFFPMTACLQHKNVLPVQKGQCLRAKLHNNEFVLQWNEIAPDECKIDLSKIKESLGYPDDDKKTNKIKTFLSKIPNEKKDPILSIMFKTLFGKESAFAKKLYMNSNEIKDMVNAGMEFGIHTHTHPCLRKLTEDSQRREIEQSKRYLERITGKPVSSIAYPYGKYNPTTIKILKLLGIKVGLKAKGGINTGKLDLFRLKRCDTNKIEN